jgi:hypothetical protein
MVFRTGLARSLVRDSQGLRFERLHRDLLRQHTVAGDGDGASCHRHDPSRSALPSYLSLRSVPMDGTPATDDGSAALRRLLRPVASSYLTRMLARRVRTDGFIEPCIPTRAAKPPSGPAWVHEVKHDGYRLIVRHEGPTVRLFTRRGYNWTDRCPAIAPAAPRQVVHHGRRGGSGRCRWCCRLRCAPPLA